MNLSDQIPSPKLGHGLVSMGWELTDLDKRKHSHLSINLSDWKVWPGGAGQVYLGTLLSLAPEQILERQKSEGKETRECSFV